MSTPENTPDDALLEEGEPSQPDAGDEPSPAPTEAPEEAIPTTGPEPAETGPEFPWSEHEELVSYAGKPPQEVAREIAQKFREFDHRKSTYDRQGQELGEARRMLAQLVGAKTQPEPSTQTKEMSEAEKAAFWDEVAQNPKAFFNQMRTGMKSELLAELGPELRGQFQAVSAYQEQAALDKAHSGWREFAPRMQAIMNSNEGLMAQPYEDIYLLATLEGSNESFLAKDVKEYMSHGLPFERSKQIALALRSQPSSKGQTQQPTGPPAQKAAAGRRSTAKPGTGEPVAETLDEAAEQVKAEFAAEVHQS